jgi:hypothetical protein
MPEPIKSSFPSSDSAKISGGTRYKPTLRMVINERAVVKRGRCRFCGAGLPHIPLAVGFGRSGPSQTLAGTNWSCNPQHILRARARGRGREFSSSWPVFEAVADVT